MSVQRILIPYKPRLQFRPFHASRKRWSCIVAHRRAGKTVAEINKLIKGALTCKREEPRFAYVAPLYAQAKDVAWSYLKRFSAPIPGHKAHEAELRVDYPNGGRVRLYGADNYDRMRGIYLDGAVIDEPADADPRAWPEVIRPALSDRQGWADFIGTPKGRNEFCTIWEKALQDSDWFTLMLRASETGILDEAELADAAKSMTEDQYQQEFECSFQAAIAGAYYGALMVKAEGDGRLCSVPYDPAVQVHTAWDLGVGDSTAIWFMQRVGLEIHLVDFYEASGVGIDHYVKVLRERPYVYGQHLLPHDAEARELGTGKTRVETLQGLGLQPSVLKQQDVDDGINAVRMLLPRCWFDQQKCARGIEALRQYRRDWDEKQKVFKPHPRHDWASHPADAFRYLAMGLPGSDTWGGSLDYSSMDAAIV